MNSGVRNEFDGTEGAHDRVIARVVRTEAGWDALRSRWDALYAASPHASTPLDFAWLRTWWRIYGSRYATGGLHVITAWRDGQLIGVLPLYTGGHDASARGVRHLRFLSTGEAESEETCAEYLNALCLPGEEDAAIAAIWTYIECLDWNELELLDLPEDSPLLRSRALPRLARTFPRGACPVADLTGGFEAYLGRLSSNSRQQARRLLREAQRVGVTFEISGTDQTAGAFDDLVRLHQERWTAEGKPGVFAAAAFMEFHRAMVAEWIPAGRAILARLSLHNEPLAVIYGFVHGAQFDFYQSGVRLDGAGHLRSPGHLAHLLLMQRLAERGVTAYDFLRTTSTSTSYKSRFATRENRLVGLRLRRPTIGDATRQSAKLAARLARRGLRSLFNGQPA